MSRFYPSSTFIVSFIMEQALHCHGAASLAAELSSCFSFSSSLLPRAF